MNQNTTIALLATATAAMLFYSCTKTVTLNLKTAASQIVIQGEVTNLAGPYTVTINQSTAFYADNTFPPISGAVVKISDDQGVTDSLTETSTGVYTTHTLQGSSGHTYTLSVFAQNTNYTASSTMPAQVPFDSVTFDHSADFGRKQIEAIVNFQDPPGVKNYYQFIEYINGVQLTKSGNIFVLDDRLSDGRYISRTLRNDSSRLAIGDLLEVKKYDIDENVYNYWYQLDQSSGSGGFNTSASPANPTSNISNGAYGYFSAHTVQSKKLTVY
ncbi:MAG TPA: DUF4249 domain-containing protein [Puia sp.]|nr:DUF4249 domain-containing protein [Puia sp.]